MYMRLVESLLTYWARMTESRERYQRWFTNLPEEFQLRQRRAVTTSHVLMLQ